MLGRLLQPQLAVRFFRTYDRLKRGINRTAIDHAIVGALRLRHPRARSKKKQKPGNYSRESAFLHILKILLPCCTRELQAHQFADN